MPSKDPVKRKESNSKYYQNNKEKQKEKQKEYYEKNRERRKEQSKESTKKRNEVHKHYAYDSIISGKISDIRKWDMWCNEIKRCAKKHKHPYSDDFTNDIMFEMMVQGCFYCGNIATTIDRVDSKLEHTPDNCVGCCKGCNVSKGAADPATFIKKAYYRSRGKYYDDDILIWFIHKEKPRWCEYRRRAEKKGVPFELTKKDFIELGQGDCEYCKRSSSTWFGVDRVVPSIGYVLDNVVSCCFDCNNDKFDDDIFTMRLRNEQIAKRVDAGELIITECEKVILHKKHV